MKKFRIGGVPEHFNLPWKLALEDKKFQQIGIDLSWKDFPKGTGDMNRALRAEEIDMAVILTEGIVRDIVKGNDSKIVQVYVKSPLLWGIHVAANSDYNSTDDLKGTHAAISRYGSGSHLMAVVNAENLDWNLEEDLKFKVIDDLDGALENLPKGKGDYFMWEKFMTKPYVDNGIFRLIDESPTPWPSFVIAVRTELLEQDEESVLSILKTINSTTEDFKKIPGIENIIAEYFGQKPSDVKKWLSLTEWTDKQLTDKELETIQKTLLHLNLIEFTTSTNKILHFF